MPAASGDPPARLYPSIPPHGIVQKTCICQPGGSGGKIRLFLEKTAGISAPDADDERAA
jgi:hypothetical protein